jgi:hypothetical protein
VVVIVDHDEVAELQVTGHGSSLGGDTLHSAAITEEGICVVVEQLVTGLVEDGGRVPLSNSKTDSVGETLTKRTSGDLNTGGVVGLRVTWGDRVDLLLLSDLSRFAYSLWILTRKFFRSSMLTP